MRALHIAAGCDLNVGHGLSSHNSKFHYIKIPGKIPGESCKSFPPRLLLTFSPFMPCPPTFQTIPDPRFPQPGRIDQPLLPTMGARWHIPPGFPGGGIEHEARIVHPLPLSHAFFAQTGISPSRTLSPLPSPRTLSITSPSPFRQSRHAPPRDECSLVPRIRETTR